MHDARGSGGHHPGGIRWFDESYGAPQYYESYERAAAVRGALQDPQRVPMVLTIDRPGVRRLRLLDTAADSDRPWSIAEIIVTGR